MNIRNEKFFFFYDFIGNVDNFDIFYLYKLISRVVNASA